MFIKSRNGVRQISYIQVSFF